jgi:outer membrane protein
VNFRILDVLTNLCLAELSSVSKTTRAGMTSAAATLMRLPHRLSFSLCSISISCALVSQQALSLPPQTDLVDVLEAAEEADPEYKQAQLNALAVAEGIPQAKAALWLPSAQFRIGTSRLRQDINLSSSSAFGNGGVQKFSTRQYRLDITQPIYHHDRIIALQQADQRLQQAQLQTVSAKQAMMLRVAERYFNVLAANDNLDFARAETQSLKSQLEQAQQRFEVGLIAITDVHEAKAGYDRASASEIQAQNLVENSREALRETTALYIETVVPLGKTFQLNVPDPQNIEAWTKTALNQNIDLTAALVAADIEKNEIRRQSAQHMPSIDVSAGHGYNRQGGRFGGNQVHQSDVGVEMTVPLYEGGSVLSRTRQAQHRHGVALEQLEQTRRLVQRETREAYLGIVSTMISVTALEQAVVSSRSALDSTRAGFEVGTRTAIDVIAAERSLFQAKRDLARARYDYVLETLRLKKAAGSLQPDDLAIVNSWLSTADSETAAESP